MNLTEAIESAFRNRLVDQYARKKRPEHLQPSLFEHAAQPTLEGLGPGRWITIRAEKDGHGGHHVFMGEDGKMKTGKFAGKSMDEAFGDKEKKKKPDYDQRREDQKQRRDPEGISDQAVDQPNIPFRERAAFAENLANTGKTEKEIADAMIDRGVAAADARRHAANAASKQSPKTVPEKPRPGIVEPAKPKNEEAKAGDQLGLFGEADRAKKPAWKPTLEESKGKQKSLFDAKGDKDQKLLFDDGVTPSDMVHQPDSDSPRAAASTAQAKLDEDYEFARASDVRNAGEDLKGSARHKINEWKGLRAAEEDGSASKMVTRDNLAKLEPHDFLVHADKNPLTSLAMHYAMRSFPAKPGMRHGDAKKNREQFLEAYRSIQKKASELAQTTLGDNALKAVASLQSHVRETIDGLRGQKGRDSMATATAADRYNQTANDLVGLHDALASGWRARKTGVVSRLNAFAEEVQEKYGKSIADIAAGSDSDEKRGILGKATEHAKDIMEGHSLNKTFGKQSKKAKRFNPAEMYVKIATREGGRNVSSVTSDPNKATQHLVDNFGVRGVQWGNYVTDDERKHHAGKTVEALTDLADTLGLHPKDIALDGALGLAVGARGKGGAVAHYEPGTKVINLTRASGVGSLAHEWGHAFDHFVNDFAPSRFATDDTDSYEVRQSDKTIESVSETMRDRMRQWKSSTSDPERMEKAGYKVTPRKDAEVRKAFSELAKAQEAYRTRLSSHLRELVKAGLFSHKSAKQYWESEPEIFARTFERYVQHKIESDGRKNTYLAGIETKGHKAGGLWPTDSEVKAMAPAFDALFTAFRKHKHGSSEKVKFSRRAAASVFNDLLIDRYDQRVIQKNPPYKLGTGVDPAGESYSIIGSQTSDINSHAEFRASVLSIWSNGSVDRYELSQAQREAGNYKMGHIRLHGLAISIETNKGQRRNPAWPPMPCDYGYIKGSVGRDGDHVDVFVGPAPDSELVVVVDQVNTKGSFDEHKCLLGFETTQKAIDCYKSAYTKGWTVGPVTTMTIQQFKNWLKLGNQSKQLHSQVSRYWAREQNDDLFLAPDSPVVDRYEWNSAAHPRFPAGTTQGGQFREAGKSASGKKRELAYLATAEKGHSLHHSNLPKQLQQRVLDWHAKLHNAVRPLMHSNFIGQTRTKDEHEQIEWPKLKKQPIRELLDEMNAMDREARADGIALSDFVNANGLIPRELAERLDGGGRFFDPEKLGNKIKRSNLLKQPESTEPSSAGATTLDEFQKGSRDQRKEMLKSPDLREAVERALGIKPSKPREDAAPLAADPLSYKPTGLSTRTRNKLDAIAGEVVGDGDEGKKKHFIETAIDSWKMMKSQAEEHNDALRQITAFFGKHHGALAANIKKGVDPSRLAGFDELVDHAVREYPQLVSHMASESESNSQEEGLVKAIRDGIRPVPQPWDDAVIDQAMKMVGPGFFDEIEPATANSDNWETVPFSVKSNVRNYIQRYWLNESTQLESRVVPLPARYRPMLLAGLAPVATIG